MCPLQLLISEEDIDPYELKRKYCEANCCCMLFTTKISSLGNNNVDEKLKENIRDKMNKLIY